jgi:hypothetical protein
MLGVSNYPLMENQRHARGKHGDQCTTDVQAKIGTRQMASQLLMFGAEQKGLRLSSETWASARQLLLSTEWTTPKGISLEIAVGQPIRNNQETQAGLSCLNFVA